MTHQTINNPDDYYVQETLISDEIQLAEREAINGLRQYDHTKELILNSIMAGDIFCLRPTHILDLNRIAIEGIWRSAGKWRQKPISISGDEPHIPPSHDQIPTLIDDMLNYVNESSGEDPFHVSAYLLWRLNWIHPFVDGNGRTSRMISYALLCIRKGYLIPGRLTIPEQIAGTKQMGKISPYYDGLKSADAAWKKDVVDVSELERMISDMYEKQLDHYMRTVNGGGGD